MSSGDENSNSPAANGNNGNGKNTSGVSNDEQETMFTCKKCPGVYFREEEKDAHRASHRDKRKTRNSKRPGPRSLTRGRQPSPAPSTTTLFSVRQRTPPPEEPPSTRPSRSGRSPATALSKESRKRKAKEIHESHAKKQKGKPQTPGG